MENESILWRRVDRPGHEACRLLQIQDGWNLAGCAVFMNNGTAVRLDYMIVCDTSWRTTSAAVAGWIGERSIVCQIKVDASLRWTMNGQIVPAVERCVDIDLNFSPSTNLLPIRRLGLAAGASGQVRAAWLRFPSFELEPLDQSYRHDAEGRYTYQSGGGQFTAQLKVLPNGFVADYPGFWERE